ncbi:hypothetical protein [Mangrovibacterium lignilyticum]|uniref:hypothetical protein n=1 Tax=Mangrovibacterium lignilyticum TaxID=2668052 RepID=UPI0013D52B93|nr:hypothetical protein [Mangrovibacterium lignilyticum]
MTENFQKKCFVCEEPVNEGCSKNIEINLPVCENCRGTENEKKAVKDLQEGMADGFVCGCI